MTVDDMVIGERYRVEWYDPAGIPLSVRPGPVVTEGEFHGMDIGPFGQLNIVRIGDKTFNRCYVRAIESIEVTA